MEGVQTRHLEHRDFARPDDVQTFEKGKTELLKMAAGIITRLTLEPGWQWSKHAKPIGAGDWCYVPHFRYQVSGRLRVRMEDGTEFESGPGQVMSLPAGHDAWVVGSETVVLVDWQSASDDASR